MPLKGRVEVDERFCKGCEECVQACPQHVLVLVTDRLNARGYHPASMVGDGCIGCAICSIVCPEAAITVYREKARGTIKQQEV